MGADFPLDLLVGLLADGSDLVVAVVVVDDVLHLQLDGGRVCGKGRNANLNKIMEDVSSLTQSLASIFALLNSVKKFYIVIGFMSYLVLCRSGFCRSALCHRRVYHMSFGLMSFDLLSECRCTVLMMYHDS